MTSQGMYSIVVGGSWNKVFVLYTIQIHIVIYRSTCSVITTVLLFQDSDEDEDEEDHEE